MGRAIDFRDHTRMEKHQTMRAKFAEWFFYWWIGLWMFGMVMVVMGVIMYVGVMACLQVVIDLCRGKIKLGELWGDEHENDRREGDTGVQREQDTL